METTSINKKKRVMRTKDIIFVIIMGMFVSLWITTLIIRDNWQGYVDLPFIPLIVVISLIAFKLYYDKEAEPTIIISRQKKLGLLLIAFQISALMFGYREGATHFFFFPEFVKSPDLDLIQNLIGYFAELFGFYLIGIIGMTLLILDWRKGTGV